MNLIKQEQCQRYIEQHCEIPRRTLRAHIISGSSKQKLEQPPILNSKLKIQLTSKIIRFA